MDDVFLASFVVTTVATVACWILVFATVPRLRFEHPDHFAAAGSPSVLGWTLLSVWLLRYLFSDKFHTLPDKALAVRLEWLRAIWLVGLPALATLFGAVLVKVGA